MENGIERVAGDIKYYEGGNGEISKGTFRNVSVTVRKISINPSLSDSDFEEIAECIHPNIQRLFAYHCDPTHYVIALDLCTENLTQYIVSKKKKSKMFLMLQGASEGLNYLHKKGILHRNLNPQNLLVDHSRGSAKISNIWIYGDTQDQRYKAVELLDFPIRPPDYSEKSDIFALGCIYHNALSNGLHPFEVVDKKIIENIKKGSSLIAKLKNVEEEYRKFCVIDLIKQMISQNPSKRPDCDYVLKHITFWNTYDIFKLVRMCNLPENRLKNFCDKNYAKIIGHDWTKNINQELLRNANINVDEANDKGLQGAIKFMALTVQYYDPEQEQTLYNYHLKFWLKYFPKLLSYIFYCIIKPSSKLRKDFEALLVPIQKCEHLYEDGGLDELFVKNGINSGQWKINRDDIDFNPIPENLIDTGINEVYKGMFESKAVAIKKLNKEDKEKKTKLIDNPREIKNLVILRPTDPENERKGKNCIVEFSGCFEDKNYPENYFLVFERAECNLKDYFYKQATFQKYHNEINERQILQDIAEGVFHIHKLKIINFDLKFENILLTRRNGVLQACVCDFGHSHETDNQGIVPYSEDVKGTHSHRAPEVNRAVTYETGSLTYKTDIHQLGKIFAYVMIDEMRKNEPDQPVNVRSLGGYCRNKKISPLQKDLIQIMSDANEKLRPDADGVRKHPYFWNNDYKLNFLELADELKWQKNYSDFEEFIKNCKIQVFKGFLWTEFRDIGKETVPQYYEILEKYKKKFNLKTSLEDDNNIFHLIKFIIYQAKNESSISFDKWLEAFGELFPFCYHKLERFLNGNVKFYSVSSTRAEIRVRRPTILKDNESTPVKQAKK